MQGSHVFPWGSDTDSSIFGIMTSVGYFYFIIILLAGIAMGDNNKFTVWQSLVLTNSKNKIFAIV